MLEGVGQFSTLAASVLKSPLYEPRCETPQTRALRRRVTLKTPTAASVPRQLNNCGADSSMKLQYWLHASWSQSILRMFSHVTVSVASNE
jgi:hypothetical protein